MFWRYRDSCYWRRWSSSFGLDLSVLIRTCWRVPYYWSHLPAHTRSVAVVQGSHAFWKVLESFGFFFLKIAGPWSWKITFVLESPGKISLKITHIFIGSNGKQAAIVYDPVCFDCCLLKYCVHQFKIFSARFACFSTFLFVIFKHSWKIYDRCPGKSWKRSVRVQLWTVERVQKNSR